MQSPAVRVALATAAAEAAAATDSDGDDAARPLAARRLPDGVVDAADARRRADDWSDAGAQDRADFLAWFRDSVIEDSGKVIGNGANGAVLVYTVRASGGGGGDDELRWVVKVQLRTSAERSRQIEREREIMAQIGAFRMHYRTSALCPAYTSADVPDDTLQRLFGAAMANTEQLATAGALESYIDLLERWGYTISGQAPGGGGGGTLGPSDGYDACYFGASLVRLAQPSAGPGAGPAPGPVCARRRLFNVQVQPFCGTESLQAHLENHVTNTGFGVGALPLLRRDELSAWFFELVWALHQLHAGAGMVHNDLVAQNVVLDRSRRHNLAARHVVFSRHSDTGAAHGVEWSFVAPGEPYGFALTSANVDGVPDDGVTWRERREGRVRTGVGEWPVAVPYADAATRRHFAGRTPPLVVSSDGDAVGLGDGLGAGAEPTSYYTVCWNSARLRPIDYGLSVLLRGPSPLQQRRDAGGGGGEGGAAAAAAAADSAELVDTEFGYLNDAVVRGATGVPPPDFYFTSTVGRSYDGDLWQAAVLVLYMGAAGRAPAQTPTAAAALRAGALSRAYARRLRQKVGAPGTGGDEILLDLLRFEYTQNRGMRGGSLSGTGGLTDLFGDSDDDDDTPTTAAAAATTDAVHYDMDAIVGDVYARRFPGRAYRPPAARANNDDEGEVEANRHSAFYGWQIESMLLTCLMQRALGNGVLPGARVVEAAPRAGGAAPAVSAPRKTVDLRNVIATWPELVYTQMYAALVDSTVALDFVANASVRLFDEFIVQPLRTGPSSVGEAGLDALRGMMAWNPALRIRGGHTSAESARLVLENAAGGDPVFSATVENARRRQAAYGTWNYELRERVAPLGALYTVAHPYFGRMRTPGTLDSVPFSGHRRRRQSSPPATVTTTTTTTGSPGSGVIPREPLAARPPLARDMVAFGATPRRARLGNVHTDATVVSVDAAPVFPSTLLDYETWLHDVAEAPYGVHRAEIEQDLFTASIVAGDLGMQRHAVCVSATASRATLTQSLYDYDAEGTMPTAAGAALAAAAATTATQSANAPVAVGERKRRLREALLADLDDGESVFIDFLRNADDLLGVLPQTQRLADRLRTIYTREVRRTVFSTDSQFVSPTKVARL